jgi:hypothetical protein
MNSQSTITTLTNVSSENSQIIGLQRWIQYFLCAGIGLVGGTTGVAIAIGLTIIIQLLLVSTAFSPGMIGMAIAATLVGLGASWLISRAAGWILPAMFEDLNERAIQIIMVFSVLTSLLQTFLFTYNL